MRGTQARNHVEVHCILLIHYSSTKPMEFPQKIKETENGELWFKGDDIFKLPRAKMRFYFRVKPNPSSQAWLPFSYTYKHSGLQFQLIKKNDFTH